MLLRCIHRPATVIVILTIVLGAAVIWRVSFASGKEARINRLLRGPSHGPYLNYHLSDEARKEIRGMGTNAIPYLIRVLDRSSRDSEQDRSLPMPRWEFLDHVADAFGALGPASAVAVPELAKRLSNPETAQPAANCLAAIGYGAKAAVPELIAAFRSTNTVLINAAARALQVVDPDAAWEAGVR
jgi:hypothetical protein